ncbi:MAG: UDP-N-acetylmuramate dehydrogenase [Phycisphaerales bacterium]|nr:UDP-N-acetylmuramate dehydrogenase [Phycisphaerales bacterium]
MDCAAQAPGPPIQPAPAALRALDIRREAPIPTWFDIGGRAEALATPDSVDDLRRCLEIDPNLRVLGDGANLLVDDDGIPGLVVQLAGQAFTRFDLSTQGTGHETQHFLIPAGARLPRLVTESVRRGLAGLEGLGGIPASLGGAVVMNAGGAFGEIAASVARVHAIGRDGRGVVLERSQIDFGYRRSGLGHLIITGVELALQPGDPAPLRQRLKDVMAYKKSTQPMAEGSAGCVFRNPTLGRDVDGIGHAGSRVSAGMIIDRAGLKGLRTGGAEVSQGHANFIVTRPGATARDAIRLMEQIQNRVRDRFGIDLLPEVVVWRRDT